MAITPPNNQWIDTQNLLILLAQSLASPLGTFSPPEQAALASRIFANFYRPSQTKHRFEAKLLTDLKTASIEMERLIVNYSVPSTPLPKLSIPAQTLGPESPKEQLPKNIGTEPQKLLRQVRIAIGELSSSKLSQLPPALPLSILTKLKPLVDSCIQILDSKKPLPIIPSPKNPVQNTQTQENKILPFTAKDQRKKLAEQPVLSPIQKEKKQALSDLKLVQIASNPQTPRPLPPDIKPIIPFPTIYPLPSKHIKKKKRKRYFFKDDEEEKEPKN